jgi:3-hydroxyacyl-[acyl-carrier-protein] dehydratase
MLTTIDIQKILPHRYPFLLIDRVLDLQLDKSIIGYKNVSINEPFFNGHFPGQPVMPGVLIIEAMAQACGVLGFKTLNKSADDGWVCMIVGINHARFRRPVLPGDQLVLEATKITEKRGIWVFACQAKVDNVLAAEAELLVAKKEGHF